jgi:ribonuclease BN (tRNA processing enzyme)
LGTIRVQVLGSDAGVSTAVRVEARGGWLLVDSGDGTAGRVLALGCNADTLRGIVFTHGHPDHVGGLYALLARLRSLGRRAPLAVRWPRGCREPRLLLDAWRARYPAREGFALRPRSFRPGDRIGLGPFTLRPFGVRHTGSLGGGRRGLLPAVGFRIRVDGRRVVLSGDTGRCEALESAVRGADLALLEATFPARSSPPRDFHLDLDEARAIGRLARRYRLYHVGKAVRPRLRPGEEAGTVTLRGPRS